jgi:hypothetical protein
MKILSYILLLKKNYNYSSPFWSLNLEGKQKWNILKNHHHLTPNELELFDTQQNVDENITTSPEVLGQGYNYS